MTRKHIRQIYRILLSICVICAGLCLIISCVGIYLSGTRPFSREAVAAAFSRIAVSVYLSLFFILAGWIGSLFFPAESRKLKPEKQYGHILHRLQSKLDMHACPAELAQAIRSEQKGRRIHRYISLALLILCSAVFLVYALNGAHFPTEGLNGAMVKAAVRFLICLAVPFAYSVFTAYWSKKSILRETELTRQALASTEAGKATAAPETAKPFPYLWQGVILGLAIGIMLYGLFSGGTVDVLTKAANICTECVGLG